MAWKSFCPWASCRRLSRCARWGARVPCVGAEPAWCSNSAPPSPAFVQEGLEKMRDLLTKNVAAGKQFVGAA